MNRTSSSIGLHAILLANFSQVSHKALELMLLINL